VLELITRDIFSSKEHNNEMNNMIGSKERHTDETSCTQLLSQPIYTSLDQKLQTAKQIRFRTRKQETVIDAAFMPVP
jgi:hypothetical protein